MDLPKEHFRWTWVLVRMTLSGPFPRRPLDPFEYTDDYELGLAEAEKLALYGSSLARLREELLPTKMLPPQAFHPVLVEFKVHAGAARDGVVLIPAVKGYGDCEYAESMLRRVEPLFARDPGEVDVVVLTNSDHARANEADRIEVKPPTPQTAVSLPDAPNIRIEPTSHNPPSLRRPVSTRDAAGIAGIRSDLLLNKLRRANKPIGGTQKKPVAQLDDIIEMCSRKAKPLRAWADRESPAPAE
jgi:hypothetical protein